MSDLRIGVGPFFDRGIDKITFKQQEGPQGLPEQRDLAPAEQGARPQLEQLLDAPNLESFLEQSARPALGDSELLSPMRFREAMDEAHAAIRGAADAAQASDPDAAKVLNRAARLLGEEKNLRDLLQMYRSVLYQG